MSFINDLKDSLNISTVALQTMVVVVIAYMSSPYETRMRNTLIAGGVGGIFYLNEQTNTNIGRVNNYRVQ